MTGIELEIAGLNRNLLRTKILLEKGDAAVTQLAYGIRPWGDDSLNPYALRGFTWRAYREILIAKQTRRRDRLVCLLQRLGRLPLWRHRERETGW